ncbi:response regulator transcription factor [Streptomyces sp. NPDC004647]|uniref:response regulator transcription factor n=1 Tax=Streptomyces sp. NPDC004647 TaxID=3154671 RepID=UPI0033AB1676
MKDPSRPGGRGATPTHAPPLAPSHAVPPGSAHTPPRLPVPPTPAESPEASSAPSPLRVVVADDNPVVRAGLGVLLGGRHDIEVVAEAADGRQACEAARRHHPDVVLLDVRMPGVDGISALPYLTGLAPVLMLTYSRESGIVQEALRRGAGGYLVHGEFTADQLVLAVRDIKSGQAHFTATAANALLEHLRLHGIPQQAGPIPDGQGGARNQPSRQQSSLQVRPGMAQSLSGPEWRRHSPAPRRTPGQETRGQGPRVDRAQFGLSRREVEVMDLIATGMSNQHIAATCFISEKTVKNHINRIFGKLRCSTRSEAIAAWMGTSRGGPSDAWRGAHGG